MQLPPTDVSYTLVVRYGRYVSRRLRREKLTELGSACDTATTLVRDHGRALEDADAPVQEALADRDGADDDLDDIAKAARHKLAGRSLEAAKQAPYTLIFAEGIGYFTEAATGDEVPRYTELESRLTAHLPASDAVRRDALPKIADGITVYRSAEVALSRAQSAEKAASARLEATKTAWRTAMERTYGALIQQFGKAGAERFFPKTRTAKAKRAKQPVG